MVKKIAKSLLIFVATFPVLFFLNTGFSNDLLWKTTQTIGFSFAFSLSLIWPFFRKYILILSGFLFIIMSVLFVFDQISWAEVSGSSGFGLVMLILIIYLPQIIKKGYVKNL